jgi:hypothetical protein
MPKKETVWLPAASAALRARLARYGPKNTVPTVVLNAELAQSYMAQPKISRLSLTVFTVAAFVTMLVSLNFSYRLRHMQKIPFLPHL